MRVTYSQNWPAYNAAQITEKAMVEKLLKAPVEGVTQPEQKRGRPRLPLADVIFAATMKVYTHDERTPRLDRYSRVRRERPHRIRAALQFDIQLPGRCQIDASPAEDDRRKRQPTESRRDRFRG